MVAPRSAADIVVCRRFAKRLYAPETWAERTSASPLAERALQLGLATSDELAACASAWRAWAADEDALFLVVHGELLATA